MAAQVHLPRGGEVADMEAVAAQGADVGGLRVLELPGDGLHEPLLREGGPLVQKDDPRLIAAEDGGGEGVYHKCAHQRASSPGWPGAGPSGADRLASSAILG